MPYLSKKRVRTRQPRFTVSAQTFFGLPITHLWALNVAGEMAIADSAGNAPGVFDPGTVKTGVYWANGHDGSQYIEIDNTGTGTVSSTTIFVGDTTGSGAPKRDIFTFLCRFYATSLPGNEGNIYCGPAGGVGIRITPGRLIQLMKENVAQVAITSNAFSFSAWHWLAVSYDGTTAKFYLDKTAVESGGSSYSFVKSGQYTFCSRYVEGSGAVYRLENGSKLSNVMIVDGVLSSDAIHSYFDNPWQIFKKQDRRIWIPSAGGGSSTNLVIQDSTHSLLSDNLDLSTSLLLTIQDSTHNLTSDSLILSTDWLLTIQDSTHNLTSDNLILNTTGSTDLIIQEAAHSLTSDNLLITTEWLLDIASAAHALTSDNLDLSTALSIIIQNAIHSHTSDTLVLDTSNTTLLTIQDSVHSHTADNLDLTLDTWLVIADAVHSHLADNIDLGTELTLTIQDSTHDLTSDIIILSIPSTGSCPTVEEIVAAIMIQIEAKNYLTLPQFLSFK